MPKACLWMCGDSRITLLQLLQLAQQAGFLAENSEVYLQANPGGAASTHTHDREHIRTYCSLEGVTMLLLVIHDDCKGEPDEHVRIASLMENVQWAQEALPGVLIRGFVVNPMTREIKEVDL